MSLFLLESVESVGVYHNAASQQQVNAVMHYIAVIDQETADFQYFTDKEMRE